MTSVKEPNVPTRKGFKKNRPHQWCVVLNNPDMDVDNSVPFILQDVFKKEMGDSFCLWLISAFNKKVDVFTSSYDLSSTLKKKANDKIKKCPHTATTSKVSFRLERR